VTQGPESGRRLRVGLFVPTWTTGSGLPEWTTAGFGSDPTWADVLETARLAEDAGVDSLWVCDHMLMDDDWGAPDDGVLRPPDGATGCRDAWAVLAALGVATHRVELGTLVGCTGYQNPARLARLADTIDEISGGRLILGLGAGDHWSEFQRFGVPLDRPIARFEEALRIIVPLLRDGRVDFQGEFYAARDCQLSPRARPSGPPILIGALGSGPRMNRLVVEFADQWNGWFTFEDEPFVPWLRERMTSLDDACRARGRAPESLARTASVSIAFDGSTAEGGSISGTHQQIAERLFELGDLGVDHVQVVTAPAGPRGVEGLAKVLEIIDRQDAASTGSNPAVEPASVP
jgi:alkanesulfonate monooxygenase SsuD/methylene tetrahydromethanopterin reductase-like flavin-dependent oxidoreductase (luciferase family)